MRALTGRGESARPFGAGLFLARLSRRVARADTLRRFQRRGQIRTLLGAAVAMMRVKKYAPVDGLFEFFCGSEITEAPLFTGIIEDLGTVQQVAHSNDGAVITVRTALPLARIALGESIAVSGCCLTVVRKSRGSIAMDVSAETLRRTILGELKPGDRVNLERCLTLNKLLGGHLVSGHVDGVGRIVSIKPEGDSRLYTFEVGANESRYLVEKGSVALDGISLTVFGIRGGRFKVAMIPHTLKMTTLGYKQAGSTLNVESDMLVKYVERILGEHGLNRRKASSIRTVRQRKSRPITEAETDAGTTTNESAMQVSARVSGR